MNEWNCPVNGDWSTIDATKPPWASGIAPLTHEQVVYVKTETERIISEYVPSSPWDNPTPSDACVQSEYNNFTNWEKAVNGETYQVIKSYDPTINLLGINEQGIITEQVEDTPSEVL